MIQNTNKTTIEYVIKVRDTRSGLLRAFGSINSLQWYRDVSFPCTFVLGNESTTQWTFVAGNESVDVSFPKRSCLVTFVLVNCRLLQLSLYLGVGLLDIPCMHHYELFNYDYRVGLHDLKWQLNNTFKTIRKSTDIINIKDAYDQRISFFKIYYI